MSWLPTVSDEQASLEVKKIYDYIANRWSFVPNYFRALGHDAQLLGDQTNLFTDLMFDERGLPRIVKEQLAIVVSGLNVSSYCLPAHMEILSRLGVDKKMGRKLSLDFHSAPVETASGRDSDFEWAKFGWAGMLIGCAFQSLNVQLCLFDAEPEAVPAIAHRHSTPECSRARAADHNRRHRTLDRVGV